MVSNGKLRTALFGGYNKADVEEYITNLEHEIDAVKVLHQKEKNELVRQIEEMKEGVINSDHENEGAKGETASGVMTPPADKEEYENLLKENAAMKEKIKCDEEEIEKLRKNKENDYFDYETVSRIMEDVRKNAAEIEEEARKKAEKLFEDARAETEQQKEAVVKRINAQLEEKGIELIAAKYKIEQYAKEIDSVQQELYNLNVRVKKMAEDMPVRLDNYWKGEHYQSLEGMLSQKEEKIPAEKESENREGEN